MNYYVKSLHEQYIDILQELKSALNEKSEPLTPQERDLVNHLRAKTYDLYKGLVNFMLTSLEP